MKGKYNQDNVYWCRKLLCKHAMKCKILLPRFCTMICQKQSSSGFTPARGHEGEVRGYRRDP